MKILILNWRDIKHHHQGGAEVVTFEHAKAWVKAGHRVTWFGSKSRGRPVQETVAGIKIIRRGNELLTVHLAAFFWYLQNGQGRFDLVIDQFHGLPFLTPLYVKVPKLAFIHEVTRDVWLLNPLPKPLNWLVGSLGYLLEPVCFLFYRQVPFLTVSESTRRDLVRYGIPRRNITVIHNGIKVIKPWPFPVKASQPTVIFLGALAKDKGIEEAIKAFGLLAKQVGNCRFWVVGGSATGYLKKLKNMAKKAGVARQIKFYGFVDNRTKFNLLAKAHLMVNPSYREGWGLVVIEANSMGTPVVGYNSPGLRDSIVHHQTGLLCRRNSPQALAANLAEALTDQKLYRRLQSGALAWSRQFSWSLAGKKSLQLINKVNQK